ncbi:MAG: hypothetical protein HOP10_00885 [Chitinophagaceae bacterium]|nr:hypothetical protein [Chitinophagaceae bacterium]
MKKILLCCLFIGIMNSIYTQTGKYFTAESSKCKVVKVFIDSRVQQFADNGIRITWDGDCSNGFASGKGTLYVFCDTKSDGKFGILYEGTLAAGKKSGYGWLVVFDPLNGQAINEQIPFFSFLYRYEYKGSFKNDEFDGYGEFTTNYPYPLPASASESDIAANQRLRLYMPFWRTDIYFSEYKGNFVNGKIADTGNGTGITSRMKWFANTVRYTGAIKKGIPNGNGRIDEANVFPLPNEQSFLAASGNFVNGVLNGYGKETGRYFEYEGEFLNGVREGKGKLTFYEWSADKPNGYLNYSRKLSSIVEGDFKNGNANGFCTIYYQNSAAYKYTGPMKNGDREGTGEVEFLDGSKFRGNFRSGVRVGSGSRQFADGSRFSGEYMNDKPVNGTMYYKDGAKYEGGFTSVEEVDRSGKKINMYKRHGSGTMTEKDGRRYNVNCNNDNCTETN